ncbi:MAG: hypothetical protein FWB73_01315 [Treponema sp.]|nr:hypothetical protein [Treponema sp.]
MKRFFIFLLTMAVSFSLFAQDNESDDDETDLNEDILKGKVLHENSLYNFLTTNIIKLSVEGKSGVLWEKIEDRQPDSENIDRVRMHSKDDAGSSFGRFRLSLDYTNLKVNLGFKVRLQWDQYNNSQNAPEWPYAFVFGNFFKDQLTVSVGKLGASPWGTGGPEMWRELEVSRFGGMRLEYKPSFVPGKLNVGFVLNWIDDVADAGGKGDPTILDLLSESVIGASYSCEWFMIRMAYRFDSPLDAGAARSGGDGKEGTKLIYRVEEYMLNKVLPGMSIWVLGEIIGIGADDKASNFFTRNWLFAQYAPSFLTAQLRFGYEVTENRSLFYIKPYFQYNFLKGLLVPSIMFGYAQDFGDSKIYPGSPFSYIEVEPKLQVNFTTGAYIAFSYYYRLEYKFAVSPPEQQTQWMNLRFGISF